jgi:hypothetical protein
VCLLDYQNAHEYVFDYIKTTFGSSLPPVVCRRAHVLFTLCSVRVYHQLFVGGLVSYLRYVLFVFTTSCL